MDSVRIGIIGGGVMGTAHSKYLLEGKVEGAKLTAVADAMQANLDKFSKSEGVALYSSASEMIKSGAVDAVLIATPHYSHTSLAVEALEAGLHVLVEKPISVHKADCEKLIAAHKGREKQVFAAMFNQRTLKAHKKLKALVAGGELGQITRVNWIITDWFRTEAYYGSGGWRATWGGEGGGVLLNQCPHQLDLLQWICGMPSRVYASCSFGKWHDIEVEDDVAALLEYPSGAKGVFVTTTGEAPGSNRFEICGERGKLILENGKLQFIRNEVSMIEFCKTSANGFDKPDTWNVEVCSDNSGPHHQGIVQNFVNAILKGEKLIAPAEEGVNSVELANAMLLSAFLGKAIDLPMDSAVYAAELKKRIDESKGKRLVREMQTPDMSKTF